LPEGGSASYSLRPVTGRVFIQKWTVKRQPKRSSSHTIGSDDGEFCAER